MQRRAVLALLCVACVACASDLRFDPQPLVYADRPEIRFAVERVEIVDRSEPASPTGAPTLDVPPAIAAKALLQSRLVAAGGMGLARASITEAGVDRQELPTTPGLVGLFLREPEATLTGRLAVRVEILAPDGEEVAAITSHARLRRAVPKGAMEVEERRIAYQLVRELVDTLDTSLENNIRQNLTRFIAAQPAA